MKPLAIAVSVLTIVTSLAVRPIRAAAECNCVAVAGDVAAEVRAEVARADGLYARGDFAGALAIYARAHAETKAAALLYAQAMCQWQLGATAEARALFEAYVAAGGDAALRARAEAALSSIDGGVTRAIAGLGDAGTAVVGAGAVAADGSLALAGDVRGPVDRPKKKVAKGAAVVLGVVAVAAVAAVGVHGIVAARKPEVDFDTKFGLGLGVGGVVVGGTAVYLWGLTAATGAAAGAPCLGDAGGGRALGVGAALRF